MPLYEFKCENCGHKSEKVMRFEDRDDPIKCSKCDSTMIRVAAAPARPIVIGGTPRFYG